MKLEISLLMRRDTVWRALSTAAGGLVLGISLAVGLAEIEDHALWSVVYLLLGALGAFVTIPFEPYGSLDLSPIVFLFVSSALSPWEGIIVAAAAPALAAAARIPAHPGKIAGALGTGGEAAAGLIFASATGGVLFGDANPSARFLLVATLSLSMIVFLQVVRVNVLEGARIRRLLEQMLRSNVLHLLFIVVGAWVVWIMFAVIGPVGAVLASVVIIEMYYPWKLLGEQRELFLKSLQMISNAVDLKDPYTAHHSQRVSKYATMMARVLDAPENEVERIRIGALMHDIGKIGVPGGLIRKPGKLTEAEMVLMRNHVEMGAGIVEELQILDRSVDIVRHHHENFDGTGYPSGIAGDRIPLGARVVFVADAYDALTTDRPYRKGRSSAEAIRILEANADTQFDQRAVDALKRVLTLTSPLPRT